MLPFLFEWVWDMGHYVFHGALWVVLSIIGMGMTFCIIKSVVDTMQGKHGHDEHH
ncbi:hypothetical protein [Desulfatitalea alkaliphila]|uniref:Uncharacterized protein n=1 Tax=Desulfatitalea alkaliphila TaxID=2929485 RepID=A0AA41R4F2_9BACT|nr:hypothetical protein [Desulfatitalea alkaliphila]MCJ8502149.1 hypothetical protein [Desulfatitalea alkaliphila]